MEKAAVIRKEHFNAAHRLHNPNWSDEKNISFYGKCNNEYAKLLWSSNPNFTADDLVGNYRNCICTKDFSCNEE